MLHQFLWDFIPRPWNSLLVNNEHFTHYDVAVVNRKPIAGNSGVRPSVTHWGAVLVVHVLCAATISAWSLLPYSSSDAHWLHVFVEQYLDSVIVFFIDSSSGMSWLGSPWRLAELFDAFSISLIYEIFCVWSRWMGSHHGFMVKGLIYVIVHLTYIVHHFLQLLSSIQNHCYSSIDSVIMPFFTSFIIIVNYAVALLAGRQSAL